MPNEVAGAGQGEATQSTDISTGSPQTPAESPVESAAPQPDWRQYVETADPEELRRHPRVAGIVGQMVDTAMRRWQSEQRSTASEQANQEAERQLLELAQKDPDAFAQRFLTDKQREGTLRQLEGLRASTRADYARMVGRAYANHPLWPELTVRDHEELQKACVGIPDDDVIGVYNATALQILSEKVAEKKANERMERFRTTELAAEREALKKELAAEGLQKSPKPDLKSSSRAPRLDIGQMSDKEFDKWYETEGPGSVLGRRSA